MKHGLNEAVAKAIILAQTASDGGKGIPDIRRILPVSNLVYADGYLAKDREIKKAAALILKAGRAGKDSGFRFDVQEAKSPFTEQDECYIVYFDFRIGAEKYQISFHTFDHWYARFASRGTERSYHARWDRKDSREAAKALKAWVFE